MPCECTEWKQKNTEAHDLSTCLFARNIIEIHNLQSVQRRSFPWLPNPSNPILITQKHNEEEGNIVWGCSIALSLLLQHILYDWLKGKHVLELGCGTGLVSICAARCGAFVTATDLPAVIPNTQYNMVSNDIQPEQMKIMPFVWGSDASVLIQSSLKFNLVLLADVVYFSSSTDQLISTLFQIKESAYLFLLIHRERDEMLDREFLNKLQECFFLKKVPQNWNRLVSLAGTDIHKFKDALHPNMKCFIFSSKSFYSNQSIFERETLVFQTLQ